MLTLLVAILVVGFASASDLMTGEPDYLSQAREIDAELKEAMFITWDGITYFRQQETMFQISDPMKYEFTDAYGPELSKSEIHNEKGFQYNLFFVWEGIPITDILNEVFGPDPASSTSE